MFYRDVILIESIFDKLKKKDKIKKQEPWERYHISKEEYYSYIKEANRVIDELTSKFCKFKGFKINSREKDSVEIEYIELTTLDYNDEVKNINTKLKTIYNDFETIIDRVLRSFEKETKYDCEPRKSSNKYYGMDIYIDEDHNIRVNVYVYDDDNEGYIGINIIEW